jgi:hypothetical protein
MADSYEIDRDASGKWVKGNKASKGYGPPHKGYGIKDLMDAELDKMDDLIPTMTKRQRVIKTIVEDAIKGRAWAVEIVLNRVYGRELERISLEKAEDLDLGALSDEELVAYNSLLTKVLNESNQD